MVSSLELIAGVEHVTLAWDARRAEQRPFRNTWRHRGETFSAHTSFNGLLPALPFEIRSAEQTKVPVPIQLAYRFRNSCDQVRYLGPFRAIPSRYYRLPARMTTDVGITGESTAGILASDAARNRHRLINIINDELSSSLPAGTWK